jgi:peptidyl-prolyl cis-trans isomerase D
MESESMLEILRKSAQGYVAKFLLSLLVLSFLGWGVSGYLNTQNIGRDVMTAGKTKLKIDEYRLAFIRKVQEASVQIGQRLNDEQIKLLRLDESVNEQMKAAIVLDEQARSMGLEISKQQLADFTAQDPSFIGVNGAFSRTQFDLAVRNSGMSQQDYFKNRKKIALRQQMIDGLIDGTILPQAYLFALALHDSEVRSLDYITLPASAIPPINTIDEAALKNFYGERVASYKAPEYRKITYVQLVPQNIVNPKTISDTQVKADYDKRIQAFSRPETRTIDQLVFKNLPTAIAAHAKLSAGSTFDDLVKSENKTLDDVALGTLKKSDVPDAKIADAAFKLSKGTVSSVIEGNFGPILVRVRDITPALVQGFDTVKEQIRNELALSDATNIILELHDQYEDARAGGDSLKKAAEKLKLKVITIDAVDQVGQLPDGKPMVNFPQRDDLIIAAFQSEKNVENAPIHIKPSGFIWYEVEKITPARERPLTEVRNRVITDWKLAVLHKNLEDKARDIQKTVENGKTLDQVAKEFSLVKKTKADLKRVMTDPDLDQDFIKTAFAGGNGYVGLVGSATGDQQTIFKVTQTSHSSDKIVKLPPLKLIGDNEKKALEIRFSDDLLEQFVGKLQQVYPVSVNEPALAAAQRLR